MYHIHGNNDGRGGCFNINNEFRDIRLYIYEKVKELQKLINLIEEYKVQHPESDLSELELPHAIDDIKRFLSEFTHYDPKLKYLFIRGMHGRFLSSQNGTRSMTAGDRPVPLGWEVFAVEERENGKVAIKSCRKYVSSKNGDQDFRCNSDRIGVNELFEMIEHEDGIYSFKGSNGKYISSPKEDEAITCNSDDIKNDQKFHIECIDDLIDEINISWAYYDGYLKKLCTKYDAAVEEKKKINPENYFITNEIEVYHNGAEKPYFTHHQQRIYKQKEFKDVMQEADNKIRKVLREKNNEMSYLSGLTWGEKCNNDKIIKMVNSLVPVFSHFGIKAITRTPNESSTVSNEEQADVYDYDDESYIMY
uniref:Uncharacterized protein n=1 Tax=Panagrolaimus sp. ES5 TaxID=591445 RepID=A0AC34FFC6_9BILA